MIIDDRAGSNELIVPLKALGIPAEGGQLMAGDVEFVGNGPEGPVIVLIEYKKLGDLFQCIRDGRFAEQMRKMHSAGDFSWLLIEGELRGTAKGAKLQSMSKSGRWRKVDAGMTYQEMVGWCMTMAARAGVHIWRTANQGETLDWVRGMYNWWTAKDWEDHRAHLDFYTPPSVGNPFQQPTLVQKVASTLPRIGPAKSLRVAQKFDTVLDMVTADEAQWQDIKGIGKKDAATICAAIRRQQ